MIEIYNHLFVGSEADENLIAGQSGWFVIHACKEPYHRRALGYTGRAASKEHPEYLIARRDHRLILNLVDVADVNYISATIIDAALDAIRDNIEKGRVLVHCNQGQSRSPAIGLLYLLRDTTVFGGMDIEAGVARFKELYPAYNPAGGMADYVRLNWRRYSSPTAV